ncbi:MAG: hypothetical protein MR419_05235, partial [Clostridiales bacterium]|nr:hypothetical protein [Clostridiales bacterium]MDY4172049.1 hypothetical protein [Evtepia sp.]
LISNEILSFETRTLRVLAVLRTAPSHTKLDALRAIKNESFLTSFRMIGDSIAWRRKFFCGFITIWVKKRRAVPNKERSAVVFSGFAGGL